MNRYQKMTWWKTIKKHILDKEYDSHEQIQISENDKVANNQETDIRQRI